MLNPSDADSKKDDPTTRRLTHFTRTWGYDGWIAVNLYPFISSDPAEMWKRANWEFNGPDWYARDDMLANLSDIEKAGRMSALRVVAFGAQPAEHDQVWLEECLERFGQPFNLAEGKRPATVAYDDQNFWCLGTNKNGQPLHPMTRGKMRVLDDAKPTIWRRT